MRKYISELIGTYGLVFFGTLAIVVNDQSGALTHIGIALTFGFAVMAMVFAFGEISGAHINPAVTLGFWFSGRLQGREVPPYLLAQFIGALLASLTVYLLFPEHPTLGATLPAGSAMQSFALECILTFFLMLVIYNVSTGSKEIGTLAGIAIGATILISALAGGPISGASMNPARSLAPALISGSLEQVWIYLVAPVLGSLLAIVAGRVISFNNPS